MTETLAKLPISPQRHRWFQRTPLPVRDESTGNERHERVCEFCSITKTTVIPPHGIPWIEWELKDGRKITGGKTPECVPSGEVAAL